MVRLGRALVAAFLCFALVDLALASGVAEPQRIVVLVSHDAAPYRDALRGFQQTLAHGGPSDASIDVQYLHGDATKLPAILQQARRERTDLYFTMGALATQGTLAEIRDTPVVAGMVLSADALRSSDNATGLVLNLPLDVQLEWLQRLLPESRNVGVLYNPRENRARIEAAERSARARGLKMIAREVENPEALPEAMKSLSKRIDVLLGIVDAVVLSPETAQAVLLFSFRNDIPFVGLSAAWAKAGAIYALDWDYEDVGSQCGELALKVLNGARAGGIAPVSPRKLTYALNLKTVRHMKVRIPDSLVRGAGQVFD